MHCQNNILHWPAQTNPDTLKVLFFMSDQFGFTKSSLRVNSLMLIIIDLENKRH